VEEEPAVRGEEPGEEPTGTASLPPLRLRPGVPAQVFQILQRWLLQVLPAASFF
jgi:hypothetical protein